MKRVLVSLTAFLVGCLGGSDSDGSSGFTSYSDEMPDDLPAGECRDTDGCDTDTDGSGGVLGTTGASVDSECQRSEDCDGAGACVATWDNDARGPFECRFACIPTLDEDAWCSDDASCCEQGDVCTPRGYCVPSGNGESSSSSNSG